MGKTKEVKDLTIKDINIQELLKQYKKEFYAVSLDMVTGNPIKNAIYLFNSNQYNNSKVWIKAGSGEVIEKLGLKGGNCSVNFDVMEGASYQDFSSSGKVDTNHEQLYEALKNKFQDQKIITFNNPYEMLKEQFPDCGITPPAPEPQPPQPTPQEPTEGTGTSCPTSGIYGGYGQKLTDIKLFLYATNVTNGTIKLNKPQLETGTVATDWRPNADEAIKHYTPAYKQVKGLAIQPGSNSKKYLEIPTVEGTIYGADLWGGDTAKLLKDEIAELKEQIKELKNQIK